MNNNKVLVRVHAASVTDYDKKLSKKLESPAKTGLEFSGEVVTVGAAVRDYAVGGQVYGYMNYWNGPKTHNELIEVPVAYMSLKPNSLSHQEAASIPIGMLTSMKALRDIAHLQEGQHVLINGASGGVGVYAIQLAKSIGAHVTATCSSHNVTFIHELGADRVFDYRKVNWIKDTTEQYDLIFDVVNNTTYSKCKHLLKPQDTYITTNPLKDPNGFALSLLSSRKSRYLMVSHGDSSRLKEISHMVESGIIKAIVDRTFPIHQATDAYKYYRAGSKKRQGYPNVIDLNQAHFLQHQNK